MCAAGPADGLDFDVLEFMGGLSVPNRFMYRRRKTKINWFCSFHSSSPRSPRSPRSLSEQQLFDLQLIGSFSFEKRMYFRLFGHINPNIVDITTTQNNYISGIEPGSPILTATLTYLAHVQLQLKFSSIVLWIAQRSDECWALSHS